LVTICSTHSSRRSSDRQTLLHDHFFRGPSSFTSRQPRPVALFDALIAFGDQGAALDPDRSPVVSPPVIVLGGAETERGSWSRIVRPVGRCILDPCSLALRRGSGGTDQPHRQLRFHKAVRGDAAPTRADLRHARTPASCRRWSNGRRTQRSLVSRHAESFRSLTSAAVQRTEPKSPGQS